MPCRVRTHRYRLPSIALAVGLIMISSGCAACRMARVIGGGLRPTVITLMMPTLIEQSRESTGRWPSDATLIAWSAEVEPHLDLSFRRWNQHALLMRFIDPSSDEIVGVSYLLWHSALIDRTLLVATDGSSLHFAWSQPRMSIRRPSPLR